MSIRFFNIVPTVSWMRYARLGLVLSAAIVLLSIGVFLVKGLNYGIDFSGGIVIEARFEQKPDLAKLRTALTNLQIGEVALQEFGDPQTILIRAQLPDGAENSDATVQKIKDSIKEPVDYRRVETVGPRVGAELFTAAMWATFFAVLGISIYIWVRFEWQFGLATFIALIHDVVTTVGLLSVTNLEFNLTAVAALLTVAGYSLNDTIVIFDRIRENLRVHKSKDYQDIINLSINQTLARTILTSGTSLVAVLALLFFGGGAIENFSAAVTWGILAGTYSSVYIGAAMLLLLPSPHHHKQKN